VFTIGHSTRTLTEFEGLLQENSITRVVDVRTVPRSRHVPQFNRETLPRDLQAVGIGYMHMPGLGGLRRARKDSQNLGWRNASFRGFADYIQTEEFEASLEDLIRLTPTERVVLMCAEAVPWRCHRSLIADALVVCGIRVRHITGTQKMLEHSLTPFARVEGNRISYPAEKL